MGKGKEGRRDEQKRNWKSLAAASDEDTEVSSGVGEAEPERVNAKRAIAVVVRRVESILKVVFEIGCGVFV